MRKAGGRMSIVTAVLCGTSSKCAFRIVMMPTSFLTDGTKSTPSQDLRLMLETSGLRATKVTSEIGND